jgi:hypothetical protein
LFLRSLGKASVKKDGYSVGTDQFRGNVLRVGH